MFIQFIMNTRKYFSILTNKSFKIRFIKIVLKIMNRQREITNYFKEKNNEQYCHKQNVKVIVLD